MGGARKFYRSDRMSLLTIVVAAVVLLLVFKSIGAMLRLDFSGSAIDQAQAQEKPEKAANVKLDGDAQAGKSDEESGDGAAEKAEETADGKDGEADGGKAETAEADGDDGAAAKDGTQANAEAGAASDESASDAGDQRFLSRSERAVLQSLAARRKSLDKRERKLDLKEKLLAATRKQVASRIKELKVIEAKIEQAFVKEEGRKKKKLKDIVSLYQNMKPKDAARIFNRLDMDVLLSVAGQMRPRNMAGIMAKMKPEVAERLTLELAANASAPKKSNELPSLTERAN